MSEKPVVISIAGGSIYQLPAKDKALLDRDTQARLTREGRSYRKLGLPISHCPPFVDPDMAAQWQCGWRWEDEEIKAREQARKERGWSGY